MDVGGGGGGTWVQCRFSCGCAGGGRVGVALVPFVAFLTTRCSLFGLLLVLAAPAFLWPRLPAFFCPPSSGMTLYGIGQSGCFDLVYLVYLQQLCLMPSS